MIAAFRLHVARDGTIDDMEVLSVRRADTPGNESVAPEVVADVRKAAVAVLRPWRYAPAVRDTLLRVTLTLLPEAAKASARPQRLVAVEACAAEAVLSAQRVVVFTGRVGAAGAVSVTRLDGPERLQDAARDLISQWRFNRTAEGTTVSSLVRFFRPDCQ